MSEKILAATSFLLDQRTVRWAFWSCVAGVLVLSLIPGGQHMPSTGWDKSDHFFAYAALAALGCRGWAGRTWTLLGMLLLLGIVIEGLQSMTGYRSGELKDVGAEGLGLLVGCAVAWLAGKFDRD